MTITINFSEQLVENIRSMDNNCRSIFSPLSELFCSLHVLLNPEGHGLMTAWAIETQKQMDCKTLAELKYFSPLYRKAVPSFFMEEMILEDKCIELQLSHLGTSFFNKNVDDLIQELKGFDNTELVHDLKCNQNLVFLKLFSFLREYHDTYFKELVSNSNLINILNHNVKKQRDYIAEKGFINFISTIDSNQIYWNNDSIKIQTKEDDVYKLDNGEKLYFIPSSVTWPHVRVNRLKNGITIIYDINSQHIGNFSRQVMANTFKILSDPVRIDILVNLNKGKKTTKNLSQILSVSEPTISHHLTLLKEAGLVNKIRDGKRVFYYNTNKVLSLIPNFYNNASR